MGYRFDYLVAELPCERCGTVSPLGASPEMTTLLRDDPQLAYLGVGDELPVDTARARASGYLVVRRPTPGEPIVLLHQWTCPTCGDPYNWAEVVVTDGIITDIRGVSLNQATLARAHFVVDELRDVAADLAGIRSSLEIDEDQVIKTLRERLPTEGAWHL